MAGRVNRIKKDTIPEDFTLPLVVTDLIPVFFFGLSTLLIGRKFGSPLFILGASVCMASGTLKALWKLIVVLWKKNVWPLFLQMRICMPIGFLMMIVSVVIHRDSVSVGAILSALTSFPSSIFFAAGIAGMVLMTVFAFRLDSSDSKSNWLEQMVNGAAQAAFFIGICLLR